MHSSEDGDEDVEEDGEVAGERGEDEDCVAEGCYYCRGVVYHETWEREGEDTDNPAKSWKSGSGQAFDRVLVGLMGF